MKEHFGFTDSEYNNLLKSGITFTDLFNQAKNYKVEKHNLLVPIPISEICLYYYLDVVQKDPLVEKTKPSTIFQALFKKLNFNDQLDLSSYIELVENNYR